jgi:mono/diheme cytochrome c family protein
MTMHVRARAAFAAARRSRVAKAAVLGGALGLSASLCVSAQAPSRAAATPAAASDGKTIYEAHCANCHGAAGKGDGPASSLLTVRPRDFTLGRFKLRSTESGAVPTDDDLLRTIKSGMHGSAMPEWAPFLSDAQVQAVATYIKSFSRRFAAEAPQAINLADPPAASPDSIARGKGVYERLKCASCHGDDGTGRGAVTTDLKDDWGRAIAATRLTEPWTFRGGATPRDILLRFRTGMSGSPMPSFKDAATDLEMGYLATYVVALARKPVWEMNAADVKAFYEDLNQQERSDKVARGRYLIDTLGCKYCHSPINEDGSAIEEFMLAGGQRLSLYPFMEPVTYNLTSDRTTGLGAWTDEQIKNVLTRGVRPDGSRMLPFPMPWPAYGSLKPEDLDALIAALRSLPPVSNAIPAPKEPGLIPYLWGKFQFLILKRDIPSTDYPGNAGTPGGASSWQTRAR